MSESKNLDLTALDLMPSWVTDLEKPSSRFQDHEPEGDKPRRKDVRRGGEFRGGDRGDRRGGPRPDQDRGRDRDRDRQGSGGYRGPDRGRDGDRGRDRDRQGRGDYRGRDRDQDRYEAPKAADPAPPVETSLTPAPSAVDALARHIRSTGRAYPMADVAKMILGGRDRYQIQFRLKDPEKDSLFLCEADRSLWISKEEAIQHVLNGPALRQYYDIEEVTLEPPRGNFTVVAVCGLSGRILGPPNHHQYQQNLVHLHRERFSDMSLERYKSRIEMKRDEETIEKWKQQISKTFQYRLRTAEERKSVESAPATAESSPPGQETPESAPPGGIGPEAAAEAAQPEPEFGPEESFAPAPTGAEEAAEATPGEALEEAHLAAEAADSDELEAEPESSAKKTEADSLRLENKEALARHFREQFADEVIKAVSEAAVPGDIPGKNLSRGLLNCLRNESERHRHGFPLVLIQLLCGEFETQGLRFFKRNRKTLYVSVTRPRPIKDEEAFTDRVRQIVDFVRTHPRAKVADLLNALVTDYQKAEKGETFQEHHLTQAEHAVLADLKWLTTEGYVIEYPDTELMLGRDESPPQPQPQPPARKKAAAGKPKKKAPKPSATPEPATAAAEPEPEPVLATPLPVDQPGAEESAGEEPLPSSAQPDFPATASIAAGNVEEAEPDPSTPAETAPAEDTSNAPGGGSVEESDTESESTE